MLDSPRAGEMTDYWRAACRDLPSQLSLPTDPPRPLAQRVQGWAHRVALPYDLVAGLTPGAPSRSVAPARYQLAAVQSLLVLSARPPASSARRPSAGWQIISCGCWGWLWPSRTAAWRMCRWWTRPSECACWPSRRVSSGVREEADDTSSA